MLTNLSNMESNGLLPNGHIISLLRANELLRPYSQENSLLHYHERIKLTCSLPGPVKAALCLSNIPNGSAILKGRILSEVSLNRQNLQHGRVKIDLLKERVVIERFENATTKHCTSLFSSLFSRVRIVS